MGLFKVVHSIPGLKQILRLLYKFEDQKLSYQWNKIVFTNRVGLAAGFDKDAKYIEELNSLGFGFIEVGTVTPKAQRGNPKPRLFRLPKDEAIINRMGFNNAGVDAMVLNLKKLRKKNLHIVVGGNIGKNKITPNEEAVTDYLICFEKLYPYVDYFVVNVSSPNTPNLRALQNKEPLKDLLSQLLSARAKKPYGKPILLKISPDLTEGQIDDIIEISKELTLDGIIAANTILDRSKLSYTEGKLNQIGNGGLSGRIMKEKSSAIIKKLRSALGNDILIIGVGGIDSPEEAIEKIESGADLIQVYTGLIYKGPNLIKRIKKKMTSFSHI